MVAALQRRIANLELWYNACMNERYETSADRWDTKTKMMGWECARCSGSPPYDEREIFFERSLCGWCAHMVDKDD